MYMFLALLIYEPQVLHLSFYCCSLCDTHFVQFMVLFPVLLSFQVIFTFTLNNVIIESFSNF